MRTHQNRPLAGRERLGTQPPRSSPGDRVRGRGGFASRSSFVLGLTLALVAGAAGCTREGGPAPAPDPLASMQLDGGKRWHVDDHTRTSIDAMRAAMRAAADDPSPERTQALGREIRDLGDRLMQGCTMSGGAHDALHGYLGALLPAVGRMAGDDAAIAKQARVDVASILDRFGTWFE